MFFHCNPVLHGVHISLVPIQFCFLKRKLTLTILLAIYGVEAAAIASTITAPDCVTPTSTPDVVTRTDAPVTPCTDAATLTTVAVSTGGGNGYPVPSGSGGDTGYPSPSMVTSTHIYTITACPSTVTNCPVGQETSSVVTYTMPAGGSSYVTYAVPTATGTGAPVPSYTAPGNSAPAYTAPGNSAPAYTAPGNSAPAYTAPGNTAPAYTAPGNSAPAYTAPAGASTAAPAPPAGTGAVPTYGAPAPSATVPVTAGSVKVSGSFGGVLAVAAAAIYML